MTLCMILSSVFLISYRIALICFNLTAVKDVGKCRPLCSFTSLVPCENTLAVFMLCTSLLNLTRKHNVLGKELNSANFCFMLIKKRKQLELKRQLDSVS